MHFGLWELAEGKVKGTPSLTSVVPLPSTTSVFSQEADGALILLPSFHQ